MTTKEYIEIISYEYMDYKDIMKVFRLGKTKAAQLKKEVALLDINNVSKYNNRLVKTDAVYKHLGLDRYESLKHLKELERR